MVKELIKKDIIFLLSSLKSTVAIIICFSLFMSMINKAYGMVTPALACYIGFYSLMAYEERNKMDLVEFALPVSRQEICLSKYIEIVLFIIFSCICSTVGSLINDVKTEAIQFIPEYLAESIMIMIGVALIYGGCMLPIIFKFGTIKARYVLFIIYIFIFVAANTDQAVELADSIQNLKIGLHISAGVGSLLIGCIVLGISYMMSIYIWKNKEV